MFWLKKSISFWLMPLPLCLALILCGLLLSLVPRRSRLGRGLLAAGAALLLLFSNRAASFWMLRPFEVRYSAIPEFVAGDPLRGPLAACRFVVVLGGGHSDMSGVPATSRLSSSALGRIVEGVRLLRVLPGARLILSGPGEPGRPTHAAVLAEAAWSLGVDPKRITLIEAALDTEDEAQAVATIAGPAPIALVTSAWHMPRAAYLFRIAGVNFVACPTDFVARRSGSLHLSDLSWDSESLERSTLAVHETLGYIWLRLRDRAVSPRP